MSTVNVNEPNYKARVCTITYGGILGFCNNPSTVPGMIHNMVYHKNVANTGEPLVACDVSGCDGHAWVDRFLTFNHSVSILDVIAAYANVAIYCYQQFVKYGNGIKPVDEDHIEGLINPYGNNSIARGKEAHLAYKSIFEQLSTDGSGGYIPAMISLPVDYEVHKETRTAVKNVLASLCKSNGGCYTDHRANLYLYSLYAPANDDATSDPVPASRPSTRIALPSLASRPSTGVVLPSLASRPPLQSGKANPFSKPENSPDSYPTSQPPSIFARPNSTEDTENKKPAPVFKSAKSANKNKPPSAKAPSMSRNAAVANAGKKSLSGKPSDDIADHESSQEIDLKHLISCSKEFSIVSADADDMFSGDVRINQYDGRLTGMTRLTIDTGLTEGDIRDAMNKTKASYLLDRYDYLVKKLGNANKSMNVFVQDMFSSEHVVDAIVDITGCRVLVTTLCVCMDSFSRVVMGGSFTPLGFIEALLYSKLDKKLRISLARLFVYIYSLYYYYITGDDIYPMFVGYVLVGDRFLS